VISVCGAQKISTSREGLIEGPKHTRTHRAEEQRDRVADVNVVDRLEQRLFDRRRDLAAEKDVVGSRACFGR
jgi:hypothetical protein